MQNQIPIINNNHNINYKKIVDEISQITGIQDPNLLVPYLLDKREKLIKDKKGFGIVMLKISPYIDRGVPGFFDYIKDSFDKKAPLIPLAFNYKYREHILYLTENNLWKLDKLPIHMDAVLARTKFWYVFVNSIRMEAEKNNKQFKEDDWDSLKQLMRAVWTHPKIQNFKYLKMIEKPSTISSRFKKRKYQFGDVSNAGITLRQDPQSNDVNGHLATNNTNGTVKKIALFGPNFEYSIWITVCKYFINSYNRNKFGIIGSTEEKLQDALKNKQQEQKIFEQGYINLDDEDDDN